MPWAPAPQCRCRAARGCRRSRRLLIYQRRACLGRRPCVCVGLWPCVVYLIGRPGTPQSTPVAREKQPQGEPGSTPEAVKTEPPPSTPPRGRRVCPDRPLKTGRRTAPRGRLTPVILAFPNQEAHSERTCHVGVLLAVGLAVVVIAILIAATRTTPTTAVTCQTPS